MKGYEKGEEEAERRDGVWERVNGGKGGKETVVEKDAQEKNKVETAGKEWGGKGGKA